MDSEAYEKSQDEAFKLQAQEDDLNDEEAFEDYLVTLGMREQEILDDGDDSREFSKGYKGILERLRFYRTFIFDGGIDNIVKPTDSELLKQREEFISKIRHRYTQPDKSPERFLRWFTNHALSLYGKLPQHSIEHVPIPSSKTAPASDDFMRLEQWFLDAFKTIGGVKGQTTKNAQGGNQPKSSLLMNLFHEMSPGFLILDGQFMLIDDDPDAEDPDTNGRVVTPDRIQIPSEERVHYYRQIAIYLRAKYTNAGFKLDPVPDSYSEIMNWCIDADRIVNARQAPEKAQCSASGDGDAIGKELRRAILETTKTITAKAVAEREAIQAIAPKANIETPKADEIPDKKGRGPTVTTELESSQSNLGQPGETRRKGGRGPEHNAQFWKQVQKTHDKCREKGMGSKLAWNEAADTHGLKSGGAAPRLLPIADEAEQ